MNTMNCEFCGSPAHIWYNCQKKPAGWKPERMRKKSTNGTDAKAPLSKPRRAAKQPASVPAARLAEIAAIPESSVDTSEIIEATTEQMARGKIVKHPGGRPRIHPDRKAYKAQKERERRAKIKAT